MTDLYFVPLGTALGASVDLEDLPELDAEQAARYRSFGYERVRVTDTDPFALCAEAALADPAFEAHRDKVDLLTYAIEPLVQSSNNWMLNQAQWQVPDIRWLVQRLEVNPERIVGLSMYNCATFLSGLDLAAMAIRSGAARTALALVAGVSNEHSPRIPHAFHIQSDGATGFLVTPDSAAGGYLLRAHVLDFVNPGEFRDLDGTIDESRYFSLKALKIRSMVERLLAAAGLRPDEIDHVFVQNLGRESMLKYGRLCGVNPDRVWLGTLADNAHVIGIDSLVNLHAYHRTRPSGRPGRLLVLGTSGMSWGGMVLEHQD
ncbi:3-oxoacyl-[acyl-carrier-protein] synthase III [Streptacidiphilus sp. MAP12-33]|uniref:3-oxoacyl-[acyl-carrier-protein] synthase III C-terminal domain-containing protein n=1 Tax=Streptacidiphilus sp. MAP12-33 TaxID=3156266 RepID=UPI0035152C26